MVFVVCVCVLIFFIDFFNRIHNILCFDIAIIMLTCIYDHDDNPSLSWYSCYTTSSWAFIPHRTLHAHKCTVRMWLAGPSLLCAVMH